MSRLRELLRVASPSTRNTQQQDVQACREGAQRLHTAQQAELMREFECLLAVVGPAYRTPPPQYREIRETARCDIYAALSAYREMAAQLENNEAGKAGGGR